MNLILEVGEDVAAALQARAQAEGMSPEQYAQRVLDRPLTGKPRSRVAVMFQENMRSVPPEIRAAIPADAASEHDHYLYGSPKKNQ